MAPPATRIFADAESLVQTHRELLQTAGFFLRRQILNDRKQKQFDVPVKDVVEEFKRVVDGSARPLKYVLVSLNHIIERIYERKKIEYLLDLELQGRIPFWRRSRRFQGQVALDAGKIHGIDFSDG